MKKFLLLFFAIASATASHAQNQIVESKFFDNWSIGVAGGKSWQSLSNFEDTKGGFANLYFTKGVTPVLSLEFASQLNILGKSTSLENKITLQSIEAIGTTKINLMNWFGGYTGAPRVFEIQARAGMGYRRMLKDGYAEFRNECFAKVGLDFDFNMGSTRAWTFTVRPAVLMPVRKAYGEVPFNKFCRFDLAAGFIYHFKNSNGTHHFTYGKPYNQHEVDMLNARINDARAKEASLENEIANREQIIAEKNARIASLEKALADCESKPAVVTTVVKSETKENLECYVYFNQGKTTIAASQMPNVERIATYLKHNPKSSVVIKGYASPEGSVVINEKIAAARAEAVRIALIQKYHIDGSRIHAEGQGVGNSFSEPDWNRVSICTIKQ